MEWSQKFNCHIITVIHSNFGSAQTHWTFRKFFRKERQKQSNTIRNKHSKQGLDNS